MNNLILYYSKTCPFCGKVIAFLQTNNIDLPELKDVREPGIRDELIGIGGKSQVPCLVIDGNPLYESNDIIKWFEANKL